MKQSISLAPSNPSSWNYLRGILTHTGTPFSSVKDFVSLYAYPRDASEKRDIVDLDNPPPSDEAELPCVQAMEFLTDIWEAEKTLQSIEKAVEVGFVSDHILFH